MHKKFLLTLSLTVSFLVDQVVAMEPIELTLDKPIKIKEQAVCMGHEESVHSVCLTLDNRIVSTSGTDKTIRIWDMTGNQLAVCKGHEDLIFSKCVTTDNRIVSGSWDHTVRIWDMKGTQLAVCRGHEKGVKSVCVTYDNMIISGSADKTVRIWDMKGNQQAICKGHENQIYSVDVTPDNMIVSGSEDGTVRVWDMEGKQLAVCKGHEKSLLVVQVTPDNRIVSRSDDKTIRIWDMKGNQQTVCRGHEGLISSVRVTPDNRIVSGSWDKTIRIWDMKGTQLAVCRGHKGEVVSICVTPDNRIVSGSFDKTIRTWDMKGTQLAVCRGHKGEVVSICVTPDNRLISGSWDKTVRIWDISTINRTSSLKHPVLVNKKNESSESIVADPARSFAIFKATSAGFTDHPTFVGKIHSHIYEIWKTLSREEAEHLRPLTSMPMPDSEIVHFILGQGHFGATYAGSSPQTGMIYAIKEVYGREAVDESLREGKIVYSLGDNPHIMPLIDYIYFEPLQKSKQPRLLQVMPLAYINGAGIKRMLTHSSNDKREKIVSDSFWQMMMGIEYLHKKGVVHLDIKAENTLYMKDGTLRIADFGRAQQVGENDQIADMESLGDIRKFSPETIAFIRRCLGGTDETVESFSGKGADVWAGGLYMWELLEDDTSNLFSTNRIPLEERTFTYTYKVFEELVHAIYTLKGKYSLALLNLLRQVLAVDPEIRLKTPQIIKKLTELSKDERKVAFEEAIRQAANLVAFTEEQTTISVYPPANPDMYVRKPKTQSQHEIYLPSGFYTKQEKEKGKF